MVNVIGLGYIGLPTALMMASHGVEVVGTDYNEELVATLNAGKTTFKEEGLDELFADALKSGIKFSTDYQVCDTYIVSVPTPYDKLDKKIDPCYVVAACKTVLKVAPEGAVLVVESTVSPNTIDRFVRPLLTEAGREDVRLVHAPERIIPGNMVYELLHNNRTIGSDDPEVGEAVAKVYASFCQGEISVTDIRTAEMTKVVENTFRAVNIAFSNELAKICRIGGMDVAEVIRIANKHPRVNILNLLCIPALVFIYYFRKTATVTWRGIALSTLVSGAMIVFVNNIIIPYTVWIGAQIDTLFVNTFGLPVRRGGRRPPCQTIPQLPVHVGNGLFL